MRLATHFGVNGNDIAKAIEYCHAFDIKYICSGYIPDDLNAFKDQFAKEGITLAMIEVGWLREDMLFGDAPKKSELSAFIDKIKLIGDAGIEIAHIFAALKSSGDETEWKRIIDCYTELGNHAEKSKVKVASHVGWAPEYIIRDCATIKRLLNDVPNPYIGVNMCLGCLQIVAAQEICQSIDATMAAFGNRLFMVHTRDIKVEEGHKWVDVAMGQGQINLAIIVDALYRSSADPLVMPEHMPKVVGEQASEISSAYALGYMSGMMKQREWMGEYE